MTRAATLALVFLAGVLGAAAQTAEEALQGTTPPLIRLEHFTDASAPSPAEEAVSTTAPVADGSTPEPAPAPPPAPVNDPVSSQPPSAAFERLQSMYDTAPAAETASASQAGGGLMANALRTFAWMCVLCAFIVLVGYLARKYASKTPLLASPQLGAVVGRIYLNPKTTIHFVRTGGKMLLLGVTPQQVSLLAELDEGAFDTGALRDISPNIPPPPAPRPADFLAELQENNRKLQHHFSEDDDLVTLRSDIQRLQQSLQEKVRDTQG